MLSRNVQNTKNERRKKLSNSNHHKLLIISIDFLLMAIEKRKLMLLNDLIGLKVFFIEITALQYTFLNDKYSKSKLTL